MLTDTILGGYPGSEWLDVVCHCHDIDEGHAHTLIYSRYEQMREKDHCILPKLPIKPQQPDDRLCKGKA